MNKRLKKKLAYLIASQAFNHETNSTKTILEGCDIFVSYEDAEEITELVSDLFYKFEELAEGWQKAQANP